MTGLPIPQPPTDNLYKFMSLSGVILIVIGLLAAFQYYLPLTEKRLQLQIEQANIAERKHTVELRREANERAKAAIDENIKKLQTLGDSFSSQVEISLRTLSTNGPST